MNPSLLYLIMVFMISIEYNFKNQHCLIAPNSIPMFQFSTALVPVFSFGENDLYCQVDNPQGSWLRRFQTKFMKIVSFAPVLFHGRGIFQYNFGFLPYRHPVTTVGEYQFIRYQISSVKIPADLMIVGP